MNSLQKSFEALKQDLTLCWDTKLSRIEAGILEDTAYNRLIESANYLDSIDPESMSTFNLFWKETKVGTTTKMNLAKK